MYNIGIDLGGTNIAAGLVDENYNIIRKTSEKHPLRRRLPATQTRSQRTWLRYVSSFATSRGSPFLT